MEVIFIYEFFTSLHFYLRKKKLEEINAPTLSNYFYTIHSLFSSYQTLKINDITKAHFYTLAEEMGQTLARKTVIDKTILINDILKYTYRKK